MVLCHRRLREDGTDFPQQYYEYIQLEAMIWYIQSETKKIRKNEVF